MSSDSHPKDPPPPNQPVEWLVTLKITKEREGEIKAEVEKYQRSEKPKRSLEYWRVAWQAVAAVGTWVGVAVALGAFLAVLNNLKQAITANNLSSEQFRLAQQPWVTARGMWKVGEFAIYKKGDTKPAGDAVGKIRVEITNTGLTPALELTAKSFVRLIPKGTVPRFDYSGSDDDGVTSRGVVAPNQIMGLEADALMSHGGVVLPEQFINDKFITIVFGYARYRDRAGKWLCSIFCARGTPIMGKSVYSACDTHNDIYEETSERPCPPPTSMP